MGKIIGAAEFKAHCLRLLDEVQRTGESITVTKRGKPVAEVKAVAVEPEKRRLLFGCMKGKITILGDIESPAYDGPWNAELGLLGDED
jgi:prevent-host-death family protein